MKTLNQQLDEVEEAIHDGYLARALMKLVIFLRNYIKEP